MHLRLWYKYFFKAFYNKIIKKEYNSQIWSYNICYTNIIAIKDLIILNKIRKKEKLSVSITDTIMLAEIAWALRLYNLVGKDKWAINNIDLDTANKLE